MLQTGKGYSTGSPCCTNGLPNFLIKADGLSKALDIRERAIRERRQFGREPKRLDSLADPTFRSFWNVPAALHAARAGNRAALEYFLQGAAFYQHAPANALDQGLHASTLCADTPAPSDS